MRVFGVIVASMLMVPAIAAQTPASKAGTDKPVGTLAQVMRGVFFPNANIIFDTQSNDPGAPPSEKNADSGGATQRFAAVYTGWQVVENSAIVLAEASDLLLYPGRSCQNGRPVPVDSELWKGAVQTMREAGIKALDAAKTKSVDTMFEATNAIADACANCHEPYRDKGDANSPARCVPPTPAELERIRKALP